MNRDQVVAEVKAKIVTLWPSNDELDEDALTDLGSELNDLCASLAEAEESEEDPA